MNHFVLVVLLFCSFTCYSQSEMDAACDKTYFSEELYKDSLGFYETLFGVDKSIDSNDERLKLAFFVALRHYPELQKVKMKMCLQRISATMQAQPRWDFIFRRKEKRAYILLVNNTLGVTGMNYKELTFNSLVGWIGHELAHVKDYTKKSNGQLFGFILSYIFSQDEIKKTENEADKETIRHGLGKPLLEGTRYLFSHKRLNKKYREKKLKFYLSPQQITEEIEKNCH